MIEPTVSHAASEVPRIIQFSKSVPENWKKLWAELCLFECASGQNYQSFVTILTPATWFNEIFNGFFIQNPIVLDL